MNGLKKVLSHRRRSSGSDVSSAYEAGNATAQTTPNTSPRQGEVEKGVKSGDGVKDGSPAGTMSTRSEPDVQRSGFTAPSSGQNKGASASADRSHAFGLSDASGDKQSQGGQAEGHSGALTSAKASAARRDPTGGHGNGVNDLTGQSVTTTDHKYLSEIEDETRQRHEIEEVTREKDLQSHHHHIQHHTVPILDTRHSAEQQHSKSHPTTHIHEERPSDIKDAELLRSVADSHGYKDQMNVKHAPSTHQVVDKGEKVQETVHHHITHVHQPIVVRDSHDHHRTATTIPVRHEVHHAPIVHQSIQHEPVSKEAFLHNGGLLGEKTANVSDANLLPVGKGSRTVDGVGEKLEKDLNLNPSRVV